MWFATSEHIDALKRHVSPVTVRDILFYFIYKHELEEIESLFLGSAYGFWKAIFRNRKIQKKFGLKIIKYKSHIKYVEKNKVASTELTNLAINKSGKRREDTTLVNWLADLQTFFGKYTNETFADVLNLPFAAVNEIRLGVTKLDAQERKKNISDLNATSETFDKIDQHIKRKSEHSRKIRLEDAIEARKSF